LLAVGIRQPNTCSIFVNRVIALRFQYRKADFTRLNQQNHDALLAMEQRGNVEIIRNSNIKEIEDEAGRPRISFAEPEHTARTFDRVIFALGRNNPYQLSAHAGHYLQRRRPGVR